MADERQVHHRPPPLPHRARRLRRRRRWRCPAAPPTGSRSWCPTWCSRRIRCPAWRPGTRAPAPSARPAAACTCGPARAARSSSRAIPSTRSTRASSAPAARPRSRGSTIPAGSRAPMARAADGEFQEITWDDAIARLAGEAGRGRQPGRGDLGRGPGHLLRSAGRVDRGAGRAAGALRAVRLTSRCAPPTARSSASTRSPAHDFGRAQVHRVLRRRLPGDLAARRSSISAGFARSHGFADGRRRQVRLRRARGWTSPASTPTSGMPIKPGSEAALALAMANVLVGGSGAGDRPASRPRSPRSRRRWPRRRPGSPPRRSSGSRGSSPRRGPAWRWPAASGSSTPAPPRSAPR